MLHYVSVVLYYPQFVNLSTQILYLKQKNLLKMKLPMLVRWLLITLGIFTFEVNFISRGLAEQKDGNVCSFTSTQIDELTDEGAIVPTKFVSYNSLVSISCKRPAQLIVSDIIQTAGPKFNPKSRLVTVTTSVGTTTSPNGPPLALPAGTTPLKIHVSVNKGNYLDAGNYRYDIQFIIVP